jgi:hypothetical protein
MAAEPSDISMNSGGRRGSFNKQSAVFQTVLNISITDANGTHLRVRLVSHQSFTPGSDPNGPPHTSFDKFTCS